jgi:archaea-specific DNA-binding protein
MDTPEKRKLNSEIFNFISIHNFTESIFSSRPFRFKLSLSSNSSMSEEAQQQNQVTPQQNDVQIRDAIYIGKKPLMAYVTSTLIQLANQPTVTIKARGLSIGRAVDVSQIILKRMENAGYTIGDVKIGSETVQSEDGRTRNVSTIEIVIKRS